MFKKISFSDEIAQGMLQNEQNSATSQHYISEQEKINNFRQLEINTEVQAAIRILSELKKEAALPARDEELTYIERIQEKIDVLKASPDQKLNNKLKVIEKYFGHIIESGTDFGELTAIDDALDTLYDKFYGDIEVILDEDESNASDAELKNLLADLDD